MGPLAETGFVGKVNVNNSHSADRLSRMIIP